MKGEALKAAAKLLRKEAKAAKLGGTKAERLARAAEQGYVKVIRSFPKGVSPSQIKQKDWVSLDNKVGRDYQVEYAGPDWESRSASFYIPQKDLEDMQTGWANGQTLQVLSADNVRLPEADFNPANIGKPDLLGSARPDLLAGMAGVSGLTAAALKSKMDTQKHGKIEAPKNPKALALANAIRDLDRRTKGSPANMLVPTSTGEFLSNVGYNQKTSTKDKLLAALEWLP
jgi:hypothetical protein